MEQFKIGYFTTTSGNSAINVEVGFIPQWLELYNDGSGAGTCIKYIWSKEMTSGYYIKEDASGNRTYETSGGPTAYSTDYFGFTFPAALHGAADKFWFKALGTGTYKAYGDLDPD